MRLASLNTDECRISLLLKENFNLSDRTRAKGPALQKDSEMTTEINCQLVCRRCRETDTMEEALIKLS